MIKSYIMNACALSFMGCGYAADSVDASQLPLVIELTLKNAPGSLSYHDIGSLAVVSKAMHPILLETVSYRKTFMIEHFQSPWPEKHTVWHVYATACVYMGKPVGCLAIVKEVVCGTTTLSFQRRQLGGSCRMAHCDTITFGAVLPASKTTESGCEKWFQFQFQRNKKHGLPRAYLCAQPYFDNCGNAHAIVQQVIGGYVDKDGTVHYVLKSDGTSEKQ